MPGPTPRSRGYAGDYYTMELLYKGSPAGQGWVGPVLDAWVLERAASKAVRNGRALVTNFLMNYVREQAPRPVTVTSLGSGPARELIDALVNPAAHQVRATCVDIDDEALAYAASLARRYSVDDRITFVNDNVIHLARGTGRVGLHGAQDVIYSVGLFDYVPDRLAVAVINWAYEHLAPGGTLRVGNVQPSIPSRAYMEYLLDWRIHRSSAQLRELFARSRFGSSSVDVASEASGVQLFASCRRDRAQCAAQWPRVAL